MNTLEKFRLDSKTVVITGGAGLLGKKHSEAVLEAGGNVALLDIVQENIDRAIYELKAQSDSYVGKIKGFVTDITNIDDVEKAYQKIISTFGAIDALINNAANNPKMEMKSSNMGAIQFENFPMSMWTDDISVGLTGAFICSKVFGLHMAERRQGVILNISSDLGIVAPDQRIYRKEGLEDYEQTIKPVTYSVIKHGLIGLTKYLATYYAEKGVRCNTLCPSGVYNGQNEEFVSKLTNLIPMGRMAEKDEYKGTVVYLLSEASKYMTGSTVVVDGGRTCW